MSLLCKAIGHNYAYNWVCRRCGDHAGVSKELLALAAEALKRPRVTKEEVIASAMADKVLGTEKDPMTIYDSQFSATPPAAEPT